MKIKFSDKVISGLEIKEKVYYVFDECTTGLHVRVLSSGAKTFNVIGGLPNNAVKTITLGAFGEMTYKEAREKAIEVYAKIRACKNKDEADQVAQWYKQKYNASNDKGLNKESAGRVLMVQINNNNLPRPCIGMRIKNRGGLIFKYVWPGLNIAVDIISLSPKDRSASKDRKIVGKHNTATLLGWDVYLVSVLMVHNGSAIDLISRAIKSKMELSHAAQD